MRKAEVLIYEKRLMDRSVYIDPVYYICGEAEINDNTYDNRDADNHEINIDVGNYHKNNPISSFLFFLPLSPYSLKALYM